jgi:hypothetical protein
MTFNNMIKALTFHTGSLDNGRAILEEEGQTRRELQTNNAAFFVDSRMVDSSTLDFGSN